jgi:hypothetical protein
MKSKFIVLLSVCLTSSILSFSQVRLEPFFAYGKYTLGLGIGNSHMYGDLEKSISQPVYRLNFERNINSYSSFGLEAEYGALSSEEYKNHWTNGLNMYNQYTAVDLNGRVSLGQFFDYPKNYFYKTLFCLYVRAGFGVIGNNITNITYKFRNKDKLDIKDVSFQSIKTNEYAYYVPASVGFNLHLTRRCMFNINYKFCYTFSDYVDGYNFPTGNAKNYYNDMYSVLSLGLSFHLGTAGTGDER